ncbi:TetR/AcrR family transcriptional regulator [Oscillospiraceae bacterium 38-13]
MNERICREKTRKNFQAVLDVSIRLFNEKGFDETSMSDICRESGLSNGSVYHMFTGKKDILKHIYQRDINVSLGLTDGAEEKLEDPAAVLLDFMLRTMAQWKKTGPMMVANKSLWSSSRTTMGCSPIQREELTRYIAMAQAAGTFNPKADVARAVEFLFTLQRGILYGWAIRDDFDFDLHNALFWPPVITALVNGTLSF